MEYREEITPEMQEKWFRSIDNFNNFYMIIHYEGKDIGLINAKNINWEKQQFESGIFIYDVSFYQTFVPAIVSLLITDVFFRLFGWETIYAHILKNNERAKSFNVMLGYEKCENQENIENQLYLLKREVFENKTEKLRKSLDKIFPGHPHTRFIIEKQEIENGFALQLRQIILSYFSTIREEKENGDTIWLF